MGPQKVTRTPIRSLLSGNLFSLGIIKIILRLPAARFNWLYCCFVPFTKVLKEKRKKRTVFSRFLCNLNIHFINFCTQNTIIQLFIPSYKTVVKFIVLFPGQSLFTFFLSL
jgi:hypothetical protein